MADPGEGVSPDGMITTGADRRRVASVYEPVLTAACARLDELGQDASLYLYGSVATGAASPPRSDVDLLSIDLDAAHAVGLSSELSAEFGGLCRAVEVAPATSDGFVGEHDAAYGNRVFLHHYCVHLAGPRRHDGLADFPADARAARGFNGDIVRHVERWRRLLVDERDPAEVGRRAARKTLLALAGIVSVSDRTWTTDRVRAAERWGQQRPDLADDLHALSDWASDAVAPTRRQVTAAIEGIVTVIADEFDRSVGLWNEP